MEKMNNDKNEKNKRSKRDKRKGRDKKDKKRWNTLSRIHLVSELYSGDKIYSIVNYTQ